jgi:hypothetical protein
VKAELTILRRQVETADNARRAGLIAGIYRDVVSNLGGQESLAEEAALITVLLERKSDPAHYLALSSMYCAVAQMLSAPSSMVAALPKLRSMMTSDVGGNKPLAVYLSLAKRIDDPSLLTPELSLLQQQVDKKIISGNSPLFLAYAAIVARGKDARSAREVLVELGKNTADVPLTLRSSSVYAATSRVPGLDPRQFLPTLRRLLSMPRSSLAHKEVLDAYLAGAAQLEPAELKAEIIDVRKAWTRNPAWTSGASDKIYAGLVSMLKNPLEVQAEAAWFRQAFAAALNGLDYRVSIAIGSIAKHMDDQVQLRHEVGAWRALFASPSAHRDPESRTSPVPLIGYLSMVARLRDDQDIRKEMSTLLSLTTPAAGQTSVEALQALARCYAELAGRSKAVQNDLRPWADFLTSQLGQEASNVPWLSDYVAAVSVMERQSEIHRTLAAIRSQWAQSAPVRRVTAESYSALARLLEADSDVHAELAELRNDLASSPSEDQATRLAASYAPIASRLPKIADLNSELTALSSAFHASRNPLATAGIARAYGEVALELTQRPDAPDKKAIVRELFLIAGNPFLDDPSGLLKALGRIAGREFVNVGTALAWSSGEYDLHVAELRPQDAITLAPAPPARRSAPRVAERESFTP